VASEGKTQADDRPCCQGCHVGRPWGLAVGEIVDSSALIDSFLDCAGHRGRFHQSCPLPRLVRRKA